MATVLDIANNQIKSSLPIPAPQTAPSKIIVKRDANKVEKNVVADLGLQNAKQALPLQSEDIERIAEEIKSVVELLNTNVSFSIEKRETRPDVVIAKVIDKDTKEVIRQIPTEEIIEIGRRLDELVGIVFNKKT
ncbi:MAG: flagellar protein FlaG [Deltaproteobacteria bacterium]|nr:flagellar protein FlaG [Deltaproteobacteria bacterium]